MGKIAVKINTELLRLIAGALFFAVGITLEQVLDNFHYIPLAVFIAGYIILGYEVVFRAFKNILRGEVFDENFLMALASIGAMIIGETAEAVGVMLFYQVGEYLQEMAVHKSKKSISALMDIRPDYANLKKDGGIVRVSPDTVNVGDLIIVKPGEKIPLDGVVVDGVSMLDTSSLTGESVPRKAGGGDTVLSGCINSTGLLAVEVKKTFGESTVSKILDLVENASAKKAPAEKFITKFARYYTPAVVAAAAAVAVFGPLVSGGAWFEWLRRGLIMLVVSCPCALVISIPLGFFGGIGAASRKGILIKGGNYLDALNYVDTVVFDKTGTLTKGVFRVTEIHPAAGFGPDELLELAARAEAFSGHPIARSVMEKYGKAVDRGELSDYEEIAGHGVRVNSGGRLIAAGNKKLMDSMNVAAAETSAAGTKIYVAVNNEFAGSIVISDEIRSDSRNAVLELKKRGIRNTVMLTGDNPEIAAAIAKKIGLDEVYGGLLPHEKIEKLEQLKAKIKKGKIAFAGDGINDAPALAMADIGIAMGGLGSDAAIEAADVVLMTDEPSKLAEAVDIAGRTRRVVLQNIVFALGIKAVVIALGVFGIAGMWEAVFADVGVALLAILNALRIIRSKRGAAVNSAGSVTLAHSAA